MKLLLLITFIIFNDVSTTGGTAISSSGSGEEAIMERLRLLEGKLVKMAKIEDENMDMKLLINQQKEQLDDLSKEMNKLKTKVTTQEQEIARLNEDRDRRRPTSDSNDGRDDFNTQRQKRFIREHGPFEPKQTTNPSDSRSTVAFSAQADQLLTVNANETIVFGYVQMNEGNGYNGTTGIFVCPKTGLYLFSYSISSFYSKIYGGKNAGIWLSVNGIPKLITVQNAPGPDLDYIVPGTVLVRLIKGDKVSIDSGINGTNVFMVSSYFLGVFLTY